MKPLLHLLTASLVLIAGVSCTKESGEEDQSLTTFRISASIVDDAESRASVSDAGAFTWSEGDEIGVWTTDGQKRFVLESGAGMNSAVFVNTTITEGITVTGPAIFPYRNNHTYNSSTKVISANQPETMSWAEGASKGIMVAKYEGSGPCEFKHVEGLVKVSLYGIPANINRVRLSSMSEWKLNGTFPIDLKEDKPAITPVSSNGSRSDFTYTITPEDKLGVGYEFYFPVPPATYNDLRIACYQYTTDKWDMKWSKTSSSANAINRGTLLLMPTLNYGSTVYTLRTFETDDTRTNLSNGDFPSSDYYMIAEMDNAWKDYNNISSKALKVTLHSDNKYINLQTSNSFYEDGYRSGMKGIRVKIRYNNASDASIYYPRVNNRSVSENTPELLPTRINGKLFDPQTTEKWAELIHPDGWNILQYDGECSGTGNIRLHPFATFEGNGTSSGSGFIYVDDFEFVKK